MAFVEYVEHFTLSEYPNEWEVLDHLGRRYGFRTEELAREWIANELDTRRAWAEFSAWRREREEDDA